MEGEVVENICNAGLERGDGGSKGKSNAATKRLEGISMDKRCLLFGYQDNGRYIPATSVRGLQIIGKKNCRHTMKT